jgi:F-type H+-transporting ATPase subunit a
MITNSFTLLQAEEHGQEAAGHEAAADAAGGGLDLQGMLMHHLTDGSELEFFGWSLHLPQWDPIHIGSFAIDFSPTKHVVFLLLAAVASLVLFLTIARGVTNQDPTKAPGGLANALEALILYFRDEVVRPNIGHGADAYTPLILTLFFFILFMNLFGLIPFGATATGNLSVTAALALVTLVVVEVSGMRALGAKGYARTIFFIPPGMSFFWKVVMLVVMTPVELMGKMAKPFALAIRLFANMTAGHTLVLSLLGIIFMFGTMTLGRWPIAGLSVGMSVAVMCLEVFVAFLQAYIFAMLTAVFLGLIRHAH